MKIRVANQVLTMVNIRPLHLLLCSLSLTVRVNKHEIFSMLKIVLHKGTLLLSLCPSQDPPYPKVGFFFPLLFSGVGGGGRIW